LPLAATAHQAWPHIRHGQQLFGHFWWWCAGGFERLHYLLESFSDGDDSINPAFAK
jgi:hypothetical protein